MRAGGKPRIRENRSRGGLLLCRGGDCQGGSEQERAKKRHTRERHPCPEDSVSLPRVAGLGSALANERAEAYNHGAMPRYLTLFSVAAVCIAGCCSPPPARRLVPSSTVMRVEPQPATCREFQDAEQQGYLIAATGRGAAFGTGDQVIQMQEGESLHVLRVDPDSGEVLVRRLDDHSLARLSPTG